MYDYCVVITKRIKELFSSGNEKEKYYRKTLFQHVSAARNVVIASGAENKLVKHWAIEMKISFCHTKNR